MKINVLIILYTVTYYMYVMNFCKTLQVRPLLPKEKIAGEEMCVRIIPATNQLVMGKDRAFTFDHILSSKTSQVNVSSIGGSSLGVKLCCCFLQINKKKKKDL